MCLKNKIWRFKPIINAVKKVHKKIVKKCKNLLQFQFLKEVNNQMVCLALQENADRERKSRLFARDRNSSSSVGKSSKKPEKIMTGQGVLSPSQVQADNTTIAEVAFVFK